MPMLTLQGPWQGMDWRETASGENSCRISLNVDVSRGYLEARDAMVARTLSIPYRARIHCMSRPGLPGEYLLLVGPNDVLTPTSLAFVALDAETLSPLGAVQNLTAIGAGMEAGDLRVSFIDTTLKPRADGVIREVVLVVLRDTTLVFEPLVNDSELAPVDLSADAVRTDSEVFPFWDTAPFGGIAETHQGNVYYAGFKAGRQVPLSAALGYTQTNVPESAMGGASTLITSPGWFARSDNADPLGLYAANFLTVPPGETVVALKSLGEALLVLSNKAAYLMTGYDKDTWDLSRVADGCGCSSYASVVTVDTVTYWLGDEGVFAFGGLAAPEVRLISDSISPLWTGEYGPTVVPDGLVDRLGNYGWPWRLSLSKLHLSVGKAYHAKDQIWWSLPIKGGPWGPLALPLTLVLHLPTMGWHLYCQTPNPSNRTNGSYVSCFADGVEYAGRWITTSGLNVLQESGPGVLCDGVANSTPGPTTDATGVPMVWCSQRLLGAGSDVSQVQSLWLKMLATGNPSSLGGSTVGSGGVAYDLPAWFVQGEEGFFDMETSDGIAVTSYDQRRTRYSALPCHPQPGADYFYGTAVYDTTSYCGVDFFTEHADVLVTSRGFVVGFVDDPWTNCARGNMVTVASINVQLQNTGRPNQ